MNKILVFFLFWPSLVLAHQDFELTIITPKVDYLVGEPIPLVFSLKDKTEEEQTLTYPFDYEWGLEVLITNSFDQTFQYISPSHAFAIEARRSSPASLSLKAGEQITANDYLSYHVPLGDFALSQPGRYQLQARFPYEKGWRSNILTVKIYEPQGNDRAALDFIVKNKLQALLTPQVRRVGANEEQRQALEELASSGKCVVGSCSFGTFDLGPNRYAQYAALGLQSLGYNVQAIDLPGPDYLPATDQPPKKAPDSQVRKFSLVGSLIVVIIVVLGSLIRYIRHKKL